MIITIMMHLFVFLLFSLTGRVRTQKCRSMSQYDQCSTNRACGCFHVTDASDSDICGFLWLTCSQLVSCMPPNNICYSPGHVCVRHPRCFSHPVCYPLLMTQQICPSRSTPLRPGDGICASARWAQSGVTVAGGNGEGSALNQLLGPTGLFVDDNQTIYVADQSNHRVIKWHRGASSGELVAGGKGAGDHNDQLNNPTDVIVNKDGTIFISDYSNERVQRWFRGAQSGQTVIGNVSVYGIAQDDQGSLYVSDEDRYEVRKWRVGEMVGQLIASDLKQPRFLFVDQNRSVYVVEKDHHRVIRLDEGTTEISIVAGGSYGDDDDQLSYPSSVIVDALGTVYVTDHSNHRIMRWPREAKSGSVIVDGRSLTGSDQLSYPTDLSFDLDGNLYVVDFGGQRVQKFAIDKSLC